MSLHRCRGWLRLEKRLAVGAQAANRRASLGGQEPQARASAPRSQRRTAVMPKWTRHPRSETTERILDAAEDLFSRRDPDNVTVREIAAKAGVTHPVVHEYLGSKADIVAAVIERGAPRRQQLMTRAPRLLRGPAARLRGRAAPTSALSLGGAGGDGRPQVRGVGGSHPQRTDAARPGEEVDRRGRAPAACRRPRGSAGSRWQRRRRWSTGGWRWMTGWSSSTT